MAGLSAKVVVELLLRNAQLDSGRSLAGEWEVHSIRPLTGSLSAPDFKRLRAAVERYVEKLIEAEQAALTTGANDVP